MNMYLSLVPCSNLHNAGPPTPPPPFFHPSYRIKTSSRLCAFQFSMLPNSWNPRVHCCIFLKLSTMRCLLESVFNMACGGRGAMRNLMQSTNICLYVKQKPEKKTPHEHLNVFKRIFVLYLKNHKIQKGIHQDASQRSFPKLCTQQPCRQPVTFLIQASSGMTRTLVLNIRPVLPNPRP